jgi:hypothetical protein
MVGSKSRASCGGVCGAWEELGCGRSRVEWSVYCLGGGGEERGKGDNKIVVKFLDF